MEELSVYVSFADLGFLKFLFVLFYLLLQQIMMLEGKIFFMSMVFI
jgi:hypothetical protein